MPSLEGTKLNNATTSTPKSVAAHDIVGHSLFDQGDEGLIHVEVHRLADAGQHRLGYERLQDWLANRRRGSGSKWTHLQFHMAMFELELGHWDDAYARFKSEILPTSASGRDALTDAPALLWHLACFAPYKVSLPWETLRRTALDNMGSRNPPFVEVHNLLALAGAKDAAGLEKWRQSRLCAPDRSRSDRVLEAVAEALHAHLTGAFQRAEIILRQLASQLPEIGGSRVQRQIFHQLHECSRRNLAGTTEFGVTQFNLAS